MRIGYGNFGCPPSDPGAIRQRHQTQHEHARFMLGIVLALTDDGRLAFYLHALQRTPRFSDLLRNLDGLKQLHTRTVCADTNTVR